MSAGQGDWRIEYDDPNRIQIISGAARTGSQSLRFTADAVEPSAGWAWYDPIQINPIAAGAPLVTVNFSMFLGSGTPSAPTVSYTPMNRIFGSVRARLGRPGDTVQA